jgi:protein O-mannosyl-transferase
MSSQNKLSFLKKNQADKLPLPQNHSTHQLFVNRIYVISLVMISLLAYHNSIRGVFVLDDYYIIENDRLHNLWSIGKVLGQTNRPLLNLSLALNYAFGRFEPAGYHVLNLLFHTGSGLALFAFLKKIFASPLLAKEYQNDSARVSFLIAAIWLTHPLTTSCITYVIQRAEAMMALGYLLTLYFSGCYFLTRQTKAAAYALLFCSLGMMTKEVMLTAPLMVLLTDRVFFSGSFRALLNERKDFYLSLSLTWLIPLYLLMLNRIPFKTAGLGLRGITPVNYLLTQPGVILHYLYLSFWPKNLCFDYSWQVAVQPADILPPLMLLGMLLSISLWAVLRFPAWGYWGCWFFIILSISSSVFPLQDLAFEHRMYLPLIAVIALGVMTWRRIFFYNLNAARLKSWMGWAVMIALSGLLIYQTILRNCDYQNDIILWQDVVKKRPQNARAYNELGLAFLNQGLWWEAEQSFKKSLSLDQASIKPVMNLGLLKARQKKFSEAEFYFQEVLKKDPHYDKAYFNLGMLNLENQKLETATHFFKEAIVQNPDFVPSYVNLGLASLLLDRLEDAKDALRQAISLNPQDEGALVNLGLVSIREGQLQEAKDYFLKVLAINAENPIALMNLGQIYTDLGELKEARKYFYRLGALETRMKMRGKNPSALLNPLFVIK